MNNEELKFVPRLDSVLQSWKGTPHRFNCAQKRYGAACAYFVAAVLDELNRRKVKQYPPFTNNRSNQRAIINEMLADNPHRVIRQGVELQPGDVVLFQFAKRHMFDSHCAIVGKGGSVWFVHRSEGVCYTGVGAIGDLIRYSYRMLDRDNWTLNLEDK